jgi:hypothetical protein
MFNYFNSGGCGGRASLNAEHAAAPSQKSLAQAYVPEQKFTKLYSPERALTAGTVFSQLDMPYAKRR